MCIFFLLLFNMFSSPPNSPRAHGDNEIAETDTFFFSLLFCLFLVSLSNFFLFFFLVRLFVRFYVKSNTLIVRDGQTERRIGFLLNE